MRQAIRLSLGQKQKINLPHPVLVNSYNRNMGAVDLFDRYFNSYRPIIKCKNNGGPCLPTH